MPVLGPDELQRLIDAGWTDRLIAFEFGMTRHAVMSLRFKHNIKTRKPGRPKSVPITMVQRWVEMLAMGQDDEAIDSMTQAIERAQ